MRACTGRAQRAGRRANNSLCCPLPRAISRSGWCAADGVLLEFRSLDEEKAHAKSKWSGGYAGGGRSGGRVGPARHGGRRDGLPRVGSAPGEERAGGRDGCRHAPAEHDHERRADHRAGSGHRQPLRRRHGRQAHPEAGEIQRPAPGPGGRAGGHGHFRDDHLAGAQSQGSVRRAVFRLRQVHSHQGGERGRAERFLEDQQPRQGAGHS